MGFKKRCVLLVGHSFKKQGHGIDTFTEYMYNSNLAGDIITRFNSMDIDLIIKKRSSLEELPKEVNELKPDLVVELHLNAFNGVVQGTETLCHNRSKEAYKVAAIFQEELVSRLGLRDRGVKKLYEGDNGYFLMNELNAPSIILEPFFMDNMDVLEGNFYESSIEGVISGINKYLGG